MKRFFTLSNFILILIFVLSFNFLIFSSIKDSSTTDESVHLFAGYTYLTKGDFRLDPEHPPLLKEMAAVPLLFFKKLTLSADGLWDKSANFYYDSWKEARTLGEGFLYVLGNNADTLIFWGRFPFIILTLLLGFAVYFWTNKLYGKKAGILAAFLTLFMPNILAHGHLINTDLGLALFMFVSVYFWVSYLKKPSWPSFLLLGLFAGLAFSSKFTSVLLIPILILLGLAKIFLDSKAKNWPKYLWGFLGALVIAFLIIWASYGFSSQAPPVPIGTFSQNIRMWADYNIPTMFDGVFARIRPFLIPGDFFKGFILVARHALGGHGAFLLGQNSNMGWWYYFPAAILFKTPIAFFILLALSIIFFKKLKAKNIFDELALILSPLVFLVFSMNSKADLGVRHVLPIFPFLIVFASKSINLVSFKEIKFSSIKPKAMIASLAFLLLILWYFLSSISSYPNYLAYFNELAGGPKGGYKILTDSNLDWGQDIYRIKKYMGDKNLDHVYLVYPWDGDVALKYYGIDYTLLKPEDTNVKGTVIISATYLQSGAYEWLKVNPAEQITPGVFVFDIK